MNLGRTYNKEDYEKAITVIDLRYEDRQRKIEHEKNLDKARSKMGKDKGKRFPSLSLQVVEVIQRSRMTRDKRRHGFLSLLSAGKTMSQSRRTIIRKKP
jgi:hypothetical protein